MYGFIFYCFQYFLDLLNVVLESSVWLWQDTNAGSWFSLGSLFFFWAQEPLVLVTWSWRAWLLDLTTLFICSLKDFSDIEVNL